MDLKLKSKLRHLLHDFKTRLAHVRPVPTSQGLHLNSTWSKYLALPQDGLEYSAGDDPSSRKNPELYGQLKVGVEKVEDPSSTISEEKIVGTEASVSYSINALKPTKLIKPEVLAPAGGWPQLKAACENGADAVYFGLSDFSARARASNFTPEELPEVMSYLRERGVKGFVALNVLVFDDELAAVEDRVRAMALAGVDAVIVQDLGVVELLKRVAPNLPIHGSTQMTITSPEGAAFVAGLGVERVVVGRELSVKEIAKVQAGTEAEIEAFVHGALCVSYSGQCFSSEAWGGRSANRGQCAQACRMPYGLIADGQIKELGDMKYLLSPQDLMAVEMVPELINAGVSCFKIEGRLKGPEYVSVTTRAYRKAVDAAWSAMIEVETSDSIAKPELDTVIMAAGKEAVQLTEKMRWDLEQVFSRGQDGEYRGLTPGFLEGVAHQRLVRGRAPRHRGVYLGKVEAVSAPLRSSPLAPGSNRGRYPNSGRGMGNSTLNYSGVMIQLSAPVKAGDGVVFDAGRPEEEECGGVVMDVCSPSGRGFQGEASPGMKVELRLSPEVKISEQVQVGDLVWKSSDPETVSRLRRTFDGLSEAEKRKVEVDVFVEGALGDPLKMRLRDRDGRTVEAVSRLPLQTATGRPMALSDVEKAVGQLGHNVLSTGSLDTTGLNLESGIFLPASEFKTLRREAADKLLAIRQAHLRAESLSKSEILPGLMAAAARLPVPSHIAGPGLTDDSSPCEVETAPGSKARSTTSGSRRAPGSDALKAASGLRVLCRSRAQVEAACAVPWLRDVILDFLEVQGLKEAVAFARMRGKRVVVATPRVLKPDEERLVTFYLKLKPDALLIRSLGLLNQLVNMGGAGAVMSQLDGLTIPSLEGDFSLNAANVLSADLLLRQGGLSTLAPTYDLDAKQLAGIARGLGARASMLEAVIHQHLPIFHTEHCVFCRFLSDGNSYRDCGHPCEQTTLHLRDVEGKDHLVLADMGCRNTVFNAQAQSGLFSIPELVSSGYRHLRIEMVDEPAEYVGPILEGYRNVLLGARPPSDLWTWLGSLPDANGRVGGVSLGSLANARDKSQGKMKVTAAALKQLQRQSS
ncbi:hypothetical protein CEUSTIGMA_g7319.t1 [Chlamydomonas eustigma]|uniref:Peptidase U32 collagenase domain-containing protein n=1 Tax=Chlamydomonas eustigma TaxID=1157962 RepID=A0A250XAF6_9CHLO|nr:hypothetical protein CEUSTIGMA_g7319.t1 [Chlamydomonas eustigma]|eukprot:GAX79879.1 hypothetical protein CEUSTIGMA_g7319.t1 [Chlamydomonas eustigma]